MRSFVNSALVVVVTSIPHEVDMSKDPQKRFKLSTGDSVELKFDENNTTGYMWMTSANKGDKCISLKESVDKKLACPKGKVGCPTERYITLKAGSAPCKTTVQMSYA